MGEPFDEIFDADALIPADQLAELRQRTNAASLARLALHATALVGAATWVVLAHGSLWIVPATVLLAALLASVFAPFHECTHQTAFATPGLNRWVASVTGIVAGQSAAGYRDFHLAHHRYTQDPQRDPEISRNVESADWPTTRRGWLVMISHAGILIGKLTFMGAAWFRPAVLQVPRDGAMARRTLLELRLAGLLWVGLLVAGLGGVPGALAMVAAFVLSHLFLGIWLQTEHTGRGFDGSILDRTRSVDTAAVVRFFLWNMSFHAEHHAWPAIPWHALPRVNARVGSHIDAAPGYLALHRQVWRALVAGSEPQVR